MDSASSIKDILGELNKESFVSLLSKLIGETWVLQNNPPFRIPEEQRIIDHVCEVLGPLSTTNGGPLLINRVAYKRSRGNLIVEYPGTVPGKVLSFVGSHMDVPSDQYAGWEFHGFSLSIEGDQLRGLGTNGCLEHVALLTELLKKLGETKLKLKSSIVVIFIANKEDSSIQGIGVEQLANDGYFDKLKGGPLYWIDTVDSQPCIGTGGLIPWTLLATGKLFHSGLPHKAINAMELAWKAVKAIQLQFYKNFPPHPKEKVYGFTAPLTMKPTWGSTESDPPIPPTQLVNQISGGWTISGDVRLTPFYDVKDVMTKIQSYVDYINVNVEKLDTWGPVSKFVLPDEGLRGRISITFGEVVSGVACDLDSHGYQVLYKAIEEVMGYVKPYSCTATLPLIRDLQDKGYDVQAVGFGLLDTYRTTNEHCLLKDMCNG